MVTCAKTLLELYFKNKSVYLPFNLGNVAFQTTEEDAVSPFACISCIKLLRDPMDDIASDPLLRKLDIEVTDGLEVCCAYSSEQITALFESVRSSNF